MKKKIRFIINPKSGSHNKLHYVQWIESGIDHSIYDADISFTEAPLHATVLSKEAAGQNYYAVVAVGGDGSVNETASGLMGSDTALGIIPTGSGNGMARHLKIPIDFKRAIDLLNFSRSDRIDTLRVNERFCIGTFGIGFDAHIAHLFAEAGTRGYSTYVKLVLSEFYKYPSHQYKVVIDGKKTELNSFLFTFANSSQFGNNAVIAPFANVKDGIIDISIVRKFPAIMAPNLIFRLMNNNLHKSRYYTGMSGKSIQIENKTGIKGHIDGEPVMLYGDIDVQIFPLSINVLVAKK